jgi:hypothetical protein
MKSENKIGNIFGFLMILTLLMFFSFSCANSESDRPEVALYAYDSAGVSLHMIFDVKNSGLLCDKPAVTEILKTPSEAINPMTYFDHEGNFGIVVSEEKNTITNSTVYGGYSYKNVGSGSEERTIAAFKRNGPGEKTIGSSGKDIWIADDGKQKKIGQQAYENYINPDGQERTDLFSQISGSDSSWLVQLGDKIYKKSDKDKKLTQVGWAGWRKITANDGKQYIILMTKGMNKNSKWAGRYDGILYRDK